jgi:hypothetical protein
LLSTSTLLSGNWTGIFIAALLSQALNIDEDVAYPGTIFLMAGVGLF